MCLKINKESSEETSSLFFDVLDLKNPSHQPPVTMGSTAICNPADIDVSVPGGAGGVHTPADAEPQTLGSSKKLHLHKAPICLLNMSPLHCQMHNVSCPLEDFGCEAVSGFCDTDIVDMGDDVTYPQGPLQVC